MGLFQDILKRVLRARSTEASISTSNKSNTKYEDTRSIEDYLSSTRSDRSHRDKPTSNRTSQQDPQEARDRPKSDPSQQEQEPIDNSSR